MEIIFAGIALLFFALSRAFVKLCERLQNALMTVLHWIAGVVALGLVAYLFYALLYPEKLS